MRALYYLLLCLWMGAAYPFQLIPFGAGEDKLKVHYQDSVLILADSAYVISAARAQLLNDRLDALMAAHQAHYQLAAVNRELLTRVVEIEKLVVRLLHKLQKDRTNTQLNMTEIITALDKSIASLQAANEQLKAHNQALERQLTDMERTVKRLRKEIRTIWWRSARDKLLIGLAGFSLGVMVE